jgi:hypothetical protein
LEKTSSKHTKIINQHLKIYTGGLVVLCAAGRKGAVKWENNPKAREMLTVGKKVFHLLTHHP